MKKLLTQWGENLDKKCPLSEYPRPTMQRENWQCLNGVWEYAFTNSEKPTKFYGEIIVPFSPESALSGVNRQLLPRQTLWYKRIVRFDESPYENGRLILHFGAVDQSCEVFLNDVKVATHVGGYWPFYADITDVIQPPNNTITISVTDLSDTSNEAYGKQKLSRGGIWYTGQSGIWQTVWCEWVPQNYIQNLKITPLYNESAVLVEVTAAKPYAGKVQVLDENNIVASANLENGKAKIFIENAKSWSPQTPFLYSLCVFHGEDKVQSYFGMRLFSMGVGKNGKPCMMLNGKPVFHNGLLDQGYWSDGMYTPPSDEAMIWEIKNIKNMGFNMLRKHIKIEPLRWYYHCDRLGMIVWQDFVSGGGPYKNFYTQYAPFIGLHFKDNKYSRFGRENDYGREAFVRDMHRTVDLLYNTVSLALWVPFNEGWGQFDAKIIAKELQKIDNTRLIDHASGYHDQGVGDLHSYHVYYKPFLHKKDKHCRALALTEFGGYSLPTVGHMTSETLFGYKVFKTENDLATAIKALFDRDVTSHIKKGLCATVYTQVSDVEDEINGVFTYDRKKTKINPEVLQKINSEIYTEFVKEFGI